MSVREIELLVEDIEELLAGDVVFEVDVDLLDVEIRELDELAAGLLEKYVLVDVVDHQPDEIGDVVVDDSGEDVLHFAVEVVRLLLVAHLLAWGEVHHFLGLLLLQLLGGLLLACGFGPLR